MNSRTKYVHILQHRMQKNGYFVSFKTYTVCIFNPSFLTVILWIVGNLQFSQVFTNIRYDIKNVNSRLVSILTCLHQDTHPWSGLVLVTAQMRSSIYMSIVFTDKIHLCVHRYLSIIMGSVCSLSALIEHVYDELWQRFSLMLVDEPPIQCLSTDNCVISCRLWGDLICGFCKVFRFKNVKFLWKCQLECSNSKGIDGVKKESSCRRLVFLTFVRVSSSCGGLHELSPFVICL